MIESQELPLGINHTHPPNNNPENSSTSLEKLEQTEQNAEKDIVVPPIIMKNHEQSDSKSVVQSVHTEQYPESPEKLKKQLQQMKQINKKLKSELVSLSDRLDGQISKRLAGRSNQSNQGLLQKQLQNSHRENDTLRKQVKHLQRRLDEYTAGQRHEDLLNEMQLRGKQVQQLQSEVKSLKKIISYQEKGLVDVSTNGVLSYVKENKDLQEQNKRLEQRLQEKDRELQKKRNVSSSKPLLQKVEDDKTINLQKQIDNLKTINDKNKKSLQILTVQKNRQAEINQELNKKMAEKDKQIEALNTKIVELRKCLRPGGKRNTLPVAVDGQTIKIEPNDSRYARRERTEPSQHSKLPSRSQVNHPLDRSMQHSSSTRNAPPQVPYRQNSPTSSSSQKLISTKLYKPTYPKLQERGSKNPSSLKFNDHPLSSQLIGLQVLTDDDSWVNCIIGRYKKGNSQSVISKSGRSINSFACQPGQFIQYISGGFTGQFLDYIVFVTNQKRLVKYGVELANSIKFDFNITAEEMPVALYGELTKLPGQVYRINRIGCFIEKVKVEQSKEDSEVKDETQDQTKDEQPIKQEPSNEVQPVDDLMI